MNRSSCHSLQSSLQLDSVERSAFNTLDIPLCHFLILLNTVTVQMSACHFNNGIGVTLCRHNRAVVCSGGSFFISRVHCKCIGICLLATHYCRKGKPEVAESLLSNYKSGVFVCRNGITLHSCRVEIMHRHFKISGEQKSSFENKTKLALTVHRACSG